MVFFRTLRAARMPAIGIHRRAVRMIAAFFRQHVYIYTLLFVNASHYSFKVRRSVGLQIITTPRKIHIASLYCKTHNGHTLCRVALPPPNLRRNRHFCVNSGLSQATAHMVLFPEIAGIWAYKRHFHVFLPTHCTFPQTCTTGSSAGSRSAAITRPRCSMSSAALKTCTHFRTKW